MPLPFLAAAGIQVGLTALGRVMAGRAPKPSEYIKRGDITIGPEVGQDIAAQTQQAFGNYRQAITDTADMAASAGLSGTGVAQSQRQQQMTNVMAAAQLIGRLQQLRAGARQFDASQLMTLGNMEFGAARDTHTNTVQGFSNMGQSLALLGSLPGNPAAAAGGGGNGVAGLLGGGGSQGITQSLMSGFQRPPPVPFQIPPLNLPALGIGPGIGGSGVGGPSYNDEQYLNSFGGQ